MLKCWWRQSAKIKGLKQFAPGLWHVYMYKIMILLNNSSETTYKPISKFHIDPTLEMWLRVCSNHHAPLTVLPIYSSSKLRTAEMMIHSLVAMIELEKCYMTSTYLQGAVSLRGASRGPWVSCLYTCNPYIFDWKDASVLESIFKFCYLIGTDKP